MSDGESLKMVPINDVEFSELHLPVEGVVAIHLVTGFVRMQREGKLLPGECFW